MEKHGTARGEFMHESLKKDAVQFDLPTEEIIQALADDNEQLEAENKRLSMLTISRLNDWFIAKAQIRELQAKNKALRELLLSHDMGTDLEGVLASLDKP